MASSFALPAPRRHHGSGSDSDGEGGDGRSTAGQGPATHLGERLAQSHQRGDLYQGPAATTLTAEQAIRAALADPSSVDEASLRMEPVPNPDSKRFEAWARMRFGVLM